MRHPRRGAAPLSPADIRARQSSALGWRTSKRLATAGAAVRFLARYGVVLRYGSVPSVPLASLRHACGPADSKTALETSIRLTNHVLGTATGIEVNIVAGRLTIVHRSNVAALYRLVRDHRAPDDHQGLSLNARTALAFVGARREVSVGDVRRHLDIRSAKRPDPADEAVAELQRAMLIDRGPFVMSDTGVPYLSREGYPYHLFHGAHVDLVREAAAITREEAADRWLAAYMAGASVATSRSMAAMFRAFLSAAEIDASLARLAGARRVSVVTTGRASIVEARRVARRL